MGDFNYGDINWKSGTTPSELTNPATAFRETLRDMYLYQHVNEPTHYRAQQHPNTLDLIITNEEGMVDNLSLSAPVGKSHHVCIHFDFTSYTEAPSRHVPKFRFHKGDYTGMREEAQKLTWYSTDDDTLEEKWHIFKIVSNI